MNHIKKEILAKEMDEYLDEYLLFYNLCRDKRHIEEEEFLMLWKTWYSDR